jgi:hypothetical protein
VLDEIGLPLFLVPLEGHWRQYGGPGRACQYICSYVRATYM